MPRIFSIGLGRTISGDFLKNLSKSTDGIFFEFPCFPFLAKNSEKLKELALKTVENLVKSTGYKLTHFSTSLTNPVSSFNNHIISGQCLTSYYRGSCVESKNLSNDMNKVNIKLEITNGSGDGGGKKKISLEEELSCLKVENPFGDDCVLGRLIAKKLIQNEMDCLVGIGNSELREECEKYSVFKIVCLALKL